jgi:uncharacterized protein YcfL
VRRIAAALLSVLLLAGCGSEQPAKWVDQDVSFDADGLTIFGTYRNKAGPVRPRC